jgi:hypothetical protein
MLHQSNRDIIDDSNLRRMIETSYVYARPDGCCTAIVPIGVIDSKAWYSVAYNRPRIVLRKNNDE